MTENFEGFVYIQIDNPMVAWNVVRSNFYSPSHLPQSERRGALSFGTSNLFRNGNASRATAEFRLEDFRRRHFSGAASRLTGIFVFDDIDSAAQVWDDVAWSGHFNPDYLTDVGVSADQSSRLDAVWITMMRDDKNILVDGWEAMAERYWSGEPASSQPIWERIIEGSITIWGRDLKERALEEIQEFWPQSLSLLEIAANSAAIGSCDGAIVPYATRKGDLLDIRYYLRMVDTKDAAFIDRLENFLRVGGERVCRLVPAGDRWISPDFSCYSFQRHIEGTSLIF
ncbi:hypothetical protein [Alloyangia pacifica]|uniref:Uncharacterized protein n=1 Tax=Alloyangia pacifica TaxID=311180 RepID=A0A1I6QKX3_9RHOB|nr:hypothetical protein [Alloyangia pacifica]SDF92114.1 hypothetical protein SAMN04488245_101139 [Alloyangia pacifica]SFS53081.1 hypothetical protein SAMN04488050_102140 [Alloyangia pacifica]